MICQSAGAQPEGVCTQIAAHIRASLAPNPVTQELQTPLAALSKLNDGFINVVDEPAPDKRQAGSKWAESLQSDHGASADDLKTLAEMNYPLLLRLPTSHVWVFDQIAGTAYCHTLIGFDVPEAGAARKLDVALPNGEAVGCGDQITAGTVNSTPTLFDESDGGFGPDFSESSIAASAFTNGAFQPPCNVKLRYKIEFSVQHAFCNGVDCAEVSSKASSIATRREQGTLEPEFSSAAMATPTAKNSDLAWMVRAASAVTNAELPVFGTQSIFSLTTFGDDSIVFPVVLHDGQGYVARLGHGTRGWRTSSDYLFALYTRQGDNLVSVAGAVVTAARSRILSVTTD